MLLKLQKTHVGRMDVRKKQRERARVCVCGIIRTATYASMRVSWDAWAVLNHI